MLKARLNRTCKCKEFLVVDDNDFNRVVLKTHLKPFGFQAQDVLLQTYHSGNERKASNKKDRGTKQTYLLFWVLDGVHGLRNASNGWPYSIQNNINQGHEQRNKASSYSHSNSICKQTRL